MYENRKMMDVTHINHLFLPNWVSHLQMHSIWLQYGIFPEAFCAQTLGINEKLGNQFSNPMIRPSMLFMMDVKKW